MENLHWKKATHTSVDLLHVTKMETSSIAVSNEETLWLNKNQKPCWWLNQPTIWKKQSSPLDPSMRGKKSNMFEVLPPVSNSLHPELPVLCHQISPESWCYVLGHGLWVYAINSKGAPARAWVWWLPGKRNIHFSKCLFQLDLSEHIITLTCPLKRDYFSREYIFKPLIFRGHVSFQGSKIGV